MKRHTSLWMLCLILATSCLLNGCFLFGPEDPQSGTTYDLTGLWLEDGSQHYMRFTTEQDSTKTYCYGREWDEGDEVYESYLKDYGDGWFKYCTKGSSLTFIALMDNGGADIPKTYTIQTATTLNLQFKDNYGQSHSFTKVIER